MADWVEAGKKAPAFTLPADDGGKVKLSALKGKPVVLYFYPRDDTPGCTREACAFRDQKRRCEAGRRGAGRQPGHRGQPRKVSRQVRAELPAAGRRRSQGGRKIWRWREKTLYGKKSMGIQRSTFLIDADGKVAKVWKKVNVDGHDEQVLAALKELME